MANFANRIDGDRVQELVRVILEGRTAKRRVDVLTWGILSADKISDVFSELADINARVARMEKAEVEFCTYAYQIVDNVITSFFEYFRDRNEFNNAREDLRQTLIIELFRLLKRYDESINSSFAKFAFSYLKLVLSEILFGGTNGDFSSANEKRFRTVAGGRLVSLDELKEKEPETWYKGSYEPDIEGAVIKKEVFRKVREAVAAVTDATERQLIEMVFFKGMSGTEACRQLNIDGNEYRKIHNRALKKIKGLLDSREFRSIYDEYRKGAS